MRTFICAYYMDLFITQISLLYISLAKWKTCFGLKSDASFLKTCEALKSSKVHQTSIIPNIKR